MDVWPEKRPQRLCHLVFGSVRCASHKGLETAPFFPLARGELSLWTRLGSWFCSDFGMFWNVWPNFWAGFLNCLFVEFLVCSILLDSFYVILLLWIVRLVINCIYTYIQYTYIWVLFLILYCIYGMQIASECVHLASLTASKTDHSHSCCWGDAKRTRCVSLRVVVLGNVSQAPKQFEMRFDDLTKNYGAYESRQQQSIKPAVQFLWSPSSTSLTTLQGIWSSWRLVSIGSSTACGWRQRYRVPTSAEMPKAPCRKWKQKPMELGMWKGLCIEKWSILKALSHFHWFPPQ